MELKNAITDVNGIKVGQAQDSIALTGCTVVLCEKGAVGGVCQRGGAPGTRETDLLRPMRLVERVNAVLLSGGSAFGLDAAGGVMRFLEERNIGFKVNTGVVPIVPAAILFDLAIGNSKIRPDAEMGYQACIHASEEKPKEGDYGAGCGATVGKMFGMKQAMKSGIGTSSKKIGRNGILAAIAAVNAFGDIVDYQTRSIIAGTRSFQKAPIKIGKEGYFANTLKMLESAIGKGVLNLAVRSNTIIGVIATNAILNKNETNYLAETASNGIALCVQPAFSLLDGDTVFSMATGKAKVDINLLCAFAPFVFADAIINAVLASEPAGGLPSAKNKECRMES